MFTDYASRFTRQSVASCTSRKLLDPRRACRERLMRQRDTTHAYTIAHIRQEFQMELITWRSAAETLSACSVYLHHGKEKGNSRERRSANKFDPSPLCRMVTGRGWRKGRNQRRKPLLEEPRKV